MGQALATGVAALGAKVVIISRTAESGQQGVTHIARMQAYLHTQDFRQRTNGVNPAEPGSNAEVPD